MSIVRKKGQRALTHKQQKRHQREVEIRGKWRSWRTFLQHDFTRDPMDRAFRGIVGRQSPEQRDRRAYERLIGRRR